MAAPILVADKITKRFGDFTAVDSLSMSIQPGEILGLLGVNGAGKTTAMNMLLGLLIPTEGSIQVFGKDLTKHRVEILKQTNFCSAYTNLPSNLRVWQNLHVFAKLYGVKNWRQRMDELLELMEIPHLKDRVTGHLSAGESTRLHLCKSLLNNPRLLMMDEPTASLDPDMADKVRKAIRHVQREHGISVLYTSHNMRDVEEVCDRVVFLHKGKILTEGTPDDIKRHFAEESLENVFIRVARSGDMVPMGAAVEDAEEAEAKAHAVAETGAEAEATTRAPGRKEGDASSS